MTKSELIQRIAQKQPQIVERDVELAVKMMLDQMAACLAGGGRIEIRGFGSFTLRFRRARVGRNPRTGTPVSLPARYAPYFKPGMRLRERVDQGLDPQIDGSPPGKQQVTESTPRSLTAVFRPYRNSGYKPSDDAYFDQAHRDLAA